MKLPVSPAIAPLTSQTLIPKKAAPQGSAHPTSQPPYLSNTTEVADCYIWLLNNWRGATCLHCWLCQLPEQQKQNSEEKEEACRRYLSLMPDGEDRGGVSAGLCSPPAEKISKTLRTRLQRLLFVLPPPGKTCQTLKMLTITLSNIFFSPELQPVSLTSSPFQPYAVSTLPFTTAFRPKGAD